MDKLVVGSREFSSRLLVGTGKYKDFQETQDAIVASGAHVVTVAIRRTNIGQDKDEPNLLDFLNPEKFIILPNTAGCYNIDDAVRTCNLARELLDGHNLVKLEVLGDEKTLFPNMTQTLEAAKILVEDTVGSLTEKTAIIPHGIDKKFLLNQILPNIKFGRCCS